MGYRDGFSRVDIRKVEADYDSFTEKEKEQLIRISAVAVNRLRKTNSLETNLERKGFLGVNQLLQTILSKEYGWCHKNQPKTINTLNRLLEVYENQNTNRIPEWDAQTAENEGFKHMEILNTVGLMLPFGAGLLSIVGGAVISSMYPETKEPLTYLGTNVCLPLFAAGAFSAFVNQNILLALQEIGRSPNSEEKLITNKHYSISRHPLYANRVLGASLFGIASLNPLGIYSALHSMYHGAKACEKQDERLVILHGEEAR